MDFHHLARPAMAGLLALAALGAAPAARADDELKFLKVFPPTTTKRELVETLKQWNQALGVRCEVFVPEVSPEAKRARLRALLAGHRLERVLGPVVGGG